MRLVALAGLFVVGILTLGCGGGSGDSAASSVPETKIPQLVGRWQNDTVSLTVKEDGTSSLVAASQKGKLTTDLVSSPKLEPEGKGHVVKLFLEDGQPVKKWAIGLSADGKSMTLTEQSGNRTLELAKSP